MVPLQNSVEGELVSKSPQNKQQQLLAFLGLHHRLYVKIKPQEERPAVKPALWAPQCRLASLEVTVVVVHRGNYLCIYFHFSTHVNRRVTT